MNYLSNKLCEDRLLKEYRTHGSLVIAVDFDNTIYDYHKAGLDLTPIISLVQLAKSMGLEVYCFTANVDHDFVRNFWKDNLEIDNIAINKTDTVVFEGSTKPFYSILLDDRAGLQSSYEILTNVLNKIFWEPTHD